MILIETIEDRHGKKSALIASQIPVHQWQVIGEQAIADAHLIVLLLMLTVWIQEANRCEKKEVT